MVKFALVVAAQVRKSVIDGDSPLRVKLARNCDALMGTALVIAGVFWHVKASVLCSGRPEHPAAERRTAVATHQPCVRV